MLPKSNGASAFSGAPADTKTSQTHPDTGLDTLATRTFQALDVQRQDSVDNAGARVRSRARVYNAERQVQNPVF
jgi:hypothetical protein